MIEGWGFGVTGIVRTKCSVDHHAAVVHCQVRGWRGTSQSWNLRTLRARVKIAGYGCRVSDSWSKV